MPKRLCALQLVEKKQPMTEEGQAGEDWVAIICGDKFGDVYSLPLIHDPEDTKTPALPPGTESTRNGTFATSEPE